MPRARAHTSPQGVILKSFRVNPPASRRETVHHVPVAAPIEHLPSEVFDNIARRLARVGALRSLVNLAQTSQTIYSLTLTHIYKEIHLSTQGAFEALLRSIEAAEREFWAWFRPRRSRTRRPKRIQGLLSDFARTERITLGDLPGRDYGERLAKLLGNQQNNPDYFITTVFPNALLLHIRPSRAVYRQKRNQRRTRVRETTPPFLTQLCEPEHVCLDHVIAPDASILRDDEVPDQHDAQSFWIAMLRHLPPDTWPKDRAPTMSWHGPLIARTDGRMDRTFDMMEAQFFPTVRVYYDEPWETKDLEDDEDEEGYAIRQIANLRLNWFTAEIEVEREIILNVPVTSLASRLYDRYFSHCTRRPLRTFARRTVKSMGRVNGDIAGPQAVAEAEQQLREMHSILEGVSDDACLSSDEAKTFGILFREYTAHTPKLRTSQQIIDILLRSQPPEGPYFWPEERDADGKRRLKYISAVVEPDGMACPVCACTCNWPDSQWLST